MSFESIVAVLIRIVLAGAVAYALYWLYSIAWVWVLCTVIAALSTGVIVFIGSAPIANSAAARIGGFFGRLTTSR